MAYQGRILSIEGGAKKVVFSFNGRVHEMHLPPFAWHFHDSSLADVALEEEASHVLASPTSRVTLEMQQAQAAAGLPFPPFIDVPSFASELCGSSADLAQQLQECVRHPGDAEYPAAFCMLMTAARMGLASAAQQLLLIDPRAGWDHGVEVLIPAFEAANSPHGAAVLQLLLAAAPEQVHMTCQGGSGTAGWTLMHAAARSGNVAAIRLLLQLTPALAEACTSFQHTPLHEAAGSGSPEAVTLLLEVAPQTAAAVDAHKELPMHWAASGGSVECSSALLDAGAPGLDVPNDIGRLPLHLAAFFDQEAAVRLLLAAHPAAAVAKDNQGRRPLQAALKYEPYFRQPIAANAARALLPVSGLSAQQLLDLLAAVPAAAQPLVQPLYVELAAKLSLSPAQWQRMPAHCPGLGRALPAVLARSEAEAAQLLERLPLITWPRLKAAALSLHRVQRTLELDVPAALIGRMLALSLSDA